MSLFRPCDKQMFIFILNKNIVFQKTLQLCSLIISDILKKVLFNSTQILRTTD